jgi:hypothetical protein
LTAGWLLFAAEVRTLASGLPSHSCHLKSVDQIKPLCAAFLQAYVVGERGIMEELAAVGINSFGGPDDNDKRATFSSEMQHDTTVGIAGLC